MARHALELTLARGSDAAVRALWQWLATRNTASLATHRGDSNAPHLTLAAFDNRPDDALDTTAELVLTSLLPMTVPVRSIEVLGAAVALVLTVPATLEAARDQLQRGTRHSGQLSVPWVPHVSLALRCPIPAQVLATARRGPVPERVTLAGARRWDPQLREVTTIVPVLA